MLVLRTRRYLTQMLCSNRITHISLIRPFLERDRVLCEAITKRGLKKRRKRYIQQKSFFVGGSITELNNMQLWWHSKMFREGDVHWCSIFIILQFSFVGAGFHFVQQRQSLGECYVMLRRSDFPWNAFNHCKTHTLSSQTGKNTQLAKHTCSRTRCCVIHGRSNFPK